MNLRGQIEMRIRLMERDLKTFKDLVIKQCLENDIKVLKKMLGEIKNG